MKKKNINFGNLKLKGKTSKEEELLKKIFGDNDDEVNSPNITIEEIYEPNEEYDKLKALDDWCFERLKENPNMKYYENQPRIYKKYPHIEKLFLKYGMNYVRELLRICPFKGIDKDSIIDSLSWTIYSKKIDPTSVITIPETMSIWDKISEDGYKE